ncbi:hypothetical protein DVP66_11570 [Yersinia enterocolitica]|nr:hypothetical protein [Yersinia enterocolitica]EKN6282659.1 hypothetical protein [Yersinia enterocolitica]
MALKEVSRLISIRVIHGLPLLNALQTHLRRFAGFCTFRPVIDGNLVHGLPMYFVGNTNIRGD